VIAQLALAATCLAIALALRPWRQKGLHDLATPLLASLVILPWLWAFPALQSKPGLPLQWSGACLVVLMVGWPLAIPLLLGVALIAGLIGGFPFAQQLELATWLGLVPATFALAIGALIRRWAAAHMFVFIIGRAFLGSVLCLFAAGALRQWFGHEMPGVDPGLSMVGRWLTAWGDAVVTGMLTAVFVAYRPQWLATWSDALYLRRPGPSQ
jgi:uncharacterized membrane protein